jgi:acetyl-CoA synthetase
MRNGEDWPNKRDLSSLRSLGTVGEPINPEAWIWYYKVIGKSDAYHRHLVADRDRRASDPGNPRCNADETGSAAMPFFGLDPVILRADENRSGCQ